MPSLQLVPVATWPAQLPAWTTDPNVASLENLLDCAAALLKASIDASMAIQYLTDGLQAVKEQVSDDQWVSVIIPAAQDHEITDLIYQCPLTRHAHARPRGYPGDADLLDLIYRHSSADAKVQKATRLGRAIFDATVAVSACEAVRERRKTVAATIDQVTAAKPGADILSVACGHLREAELSRALQSNRVGTFYALDQDPLSLSAVEAYASECGGRIRPRRMTVRDMIGDRHDLPQFDLIYSAGLYDYLQAPSAARLTQKLFGHLRSGGTLLLANFLEGIWETPYMEAYMDWYLTYRSEREINGFLSEIPETQIASRCYWTDSSERIGYLEVTRR